MGFNKDNKESWWFVSDENMMLNHPVWGDPTDIGKWDSIEQTYTAYYTYGYKPFADAIKSCWHKTEYKFFLWKLLFGYYYQGERYPGETNTSMSRDHLVYSFMCYLHDGMSKEDMYEYVSHFRLVVSPKMGMHMTPDLWLWLRLICGKKIGWLYYPVAYVSTIFNNVWNNLLNSITGYNFGTEEHQNTYTIVYGKPKIFENIRTMYTPTYALKLLVNQVSVLPDNWWTKQIKKQIVKSIPSLNYVFKMLMNVELTDDEKNEVFAYRSMTANRWSDQLNKWWSDRPEYIIEDKYPGKNYTIENNLEKDYLMKLYNERYNKI